MTLLSRLRALNPQPWYLKEKKMSSPQTNVINSAWLVVKIIIIENPNYFVTAARKLDMLNQFE